MVLNCRNCNTRASFNYVGLKPRYCSKCKSEGMINIYKKNKKFEPKCSNCKMPNNSYYNYKGLKPRYCIECKEENMIDVKHKHCEICKLFQAKQKYNWLCLTCFMWKNPEHIITRKYREKEMFVVNKIKDQYKNYDIRYNQTIGGCSKRRPDILIELYTHCIIIEVDENQHKNYICEEKRINEIYTDLGDRNLVLIRFNPDKYGLKPPMLNNNKEIEYRIDILFNCIDKYIPVVYEPFTEIKLFFDPPASRVQSERSTI